MNPTHYSSETSAANEALLAKKLWIVGSWAGLATTQAGFGPREFEALAICANFEGFGARVRPDTARLLSWQTLPVLEALYGQAEPAVRKATGAHRDFSPMYPGFPSQVLNASDAELARTALDHYGSVLAGLRTLPSHGGSLRQPETGNAAALVRGPEFNIASEDEALEMLRSLSLSNVSMGQTDREAVLALAKAFASLGRAEDAAAALCGGSNKENLAFCAVAARDIGALGAFCSQLSVCTDALRVACALSGGDPSLATTTKFVTFARPVRRALMGVIERHLTSGDTEQAMENLFARREPWLRLGEKLHPGELEAKFPLAAMAFSDLRSGKSPRPYADKLKEALSGPDAAAGAIRLLRSRPGEFARRAAAASRALGPSARDALAKAFDGCASNVSTPVLLQARSAFLHAAEGPSVSRAFMPKGGMSRIYLRESTGTDAHSIDPAFATAMADSCERALFERFTAFAPLGKVYVDPLLDQIHTPFAARSASRQTRCLARGSRLPVSGAIARLFAWWGESGTGKDGTDLSCGRIDVDLSCLFLGADFQPMGHVSWTMLRSGGAVVHSGDIVSAPHGACEFIDVDYAKLDPDIKYIAMTVHSFTGQSFEAMPECFAGWMGREAGMAGRVFDARAVLGKSDIALASTNCMPMFLDVDARQAVWADLAMPKSTGYSMVERQSKTISMAVKALATMSKPTMGDLARLHANARGTLVASEAEADVVFSLERGVTPYDFELIASELLADTPPDHPTIHKPKVPAPMGPSPSQDTTALTTDGAPKHTQSTREL